MGIVEDVTAAYGWPPSEQPDPDAYVANAQHHLKLLRSTIHDGLPNKSDTFLKVSLLYDLDDAEENLRKALA